MDTLKTIDKEKKKENMSPTTKKSRIPLPLSHLPPLPENVLKKRRNSEAEYRNPLKVINNQQYTNSIDSAGPSTSSRTVSNEIIHPFRLDTRHVTLRQRNEELDWNFEVFKDIKDRKEPQIIVISSSSSSSDESGDDNIIPNRESNIRCITGLQQITTNRIATPIQHLVRSKRVKNVKRSLKRPHSQELQGISVAPEERQEKEITQSCRISSDGRLQDGAISAKYSFTTPVSSLAQEYPSDIISHLMSAENELNPIIPNLPSITRACIINWLIKVNGPNKDPMIIQTAVWYFDSLLSLGSVKLDKLQLAAAACYWIALKLHGPAVRASILVKYSKNAFTKEQLIHTERFVLVKLHFPLQPVVPQNFISYLSWWCDISSPETIEIAATFICLSGQMVNKTLCSKYPSVIGAAAVKNALLLLKRRDLLMRLKACPVFKSIEDKSSYMDFVGSVQRRAVRLMGDLLYEYNAPLEVYGQGPHYIAQRVLEAASDLAKKNKNDTRNE